MGPSSTTALLPLLLLLLVSSTAKLLRGELRTTQDWVFVARFCFLSHYGRFEYHIEYSKEFAYQNLLLYYDSDTQWPAVYNTNKTCEEKERILKRELLQIVPLSPNESDSGCALVEVDGNSGVGRGGNGRTLQPNPQQRRVAPVVACNSSKSFRSARERWWFLAVSRCRSSVGLSMKYTFLMTNGPPGDLWHEHFSADEFYIMPVLLGFSLLYLLIITAAVLCSKELRARQLLHSTYKLFGASVALQAAGVWARAASCARYALDGEPRPALSDAGRLLQSAGEVAFLLLLLLLAKGFTVTRGRLRLASTVKLTVFVCLYAVCYSLLFLYETQYFDPGEVLYLYESPAGYGLVALRLAAWWMFIYSTIFTLKHYPEKATFYYPFNLVGTLWFVTGPAFILCTNTFIDKWVRESVVCFVQHAIAASGHILFLMLTVPSKANKNFPYHVRTTQIGVMLVTDGTLGNNTLDHFGHHPYALDPHLDPAPDSVRAWHHHQEWKAKTSSAIARPEEILATTQPTQMQMQMHVPDFTAPALRNIYLPT